MMCVDQTLLASDQNEQRGIYGNCLQAAVASAFDLPLDAVPDFAAFDASWEEALSLWLRATKRGTYKRVQVPPDKRLCVLIGQSPRRLKHVCVGLGSQLMWDPHPSRAGLASVESALVFEPPDEQES